MTDERRGITTYAIDCAREGHGCESKRCEGTHREFWFREHARDHD